MQKIKTGVIKEEAQRKDVGMVLIMEKEGRFNFECQMAERPVKQMFFSRLGHRHRTLVSVGGYKCMVICSRMTLGALYYRQRCLLQDSSSVRCRQTPRRREREEEKSKGKLQ